MKAIVLQKKNIAQDSLLLETLLENGNRKKIKLAGILKSKRRYIFHLTAGSIWRFTAAHFNNATVIPKELEFILSPVGDSPTYQQLLLVSELLFPLICLTKAEDHKEVFRYYQELVSHWQNLDELEQHAFLIYFYFFILKQNGFLNSQHHCSICSIALTQTDFYFFAHGGVCQKCAQSLPTEPTISFGHFSSRQFYKNQNNPLAFLKSEILTLRHFVQSLPD